MTLTAKSFVNKLSAVLFTATIFFGLFRNESALWLVGAITIVLLAYVLADIALDSFRHKL